MPETLEAATASSQGGRALAGRKRTTVNAATEFACPPFPIGEPIFYKSLVVRSHSARPVDRRVAVGRGALQASCLKWRRP